MQIAGLLLLYDTVIRSLFLPPVLWGLFWEEREECGWGLVLYNEIYEWVLFDWLCISGLLWESCASLLMTQHNVIQYQ